jgi:RNA polymerase sigma-70 factor (ECF subfamily)
LTDEELIVRVREGERELFAVLVERYKRGIANFIGASLRDGSDVADLSQETFLRAYAHLGTFNPQLGKFSTWIYQIARNVVRTHLGRTLRKPAAQPLAEEQTLENSLPDLSREADPAGGVLRDEAERELRTALAELPERTRTVLALRYFDNMEYHTIASTLGLSLGNVKTLIHRGKIALAKKMRELEARPAAAMERGGPRALLLV